MLTLIPSLSGEVCQVFPSWCGPFSVSILPFLKATVYRPHLRGTLEGENVYKSLGILLLETLGHLSVLVCSVIYSYENALMHVHFIYVRGRECVVIQGAYTLGNLLYES